MRHSISLPKKPSRSSPKHQKLSKLSQIISSLTVPIGQRCYSSLKSTINMFQSQASCMLPKNLLLSDQVSWQIFQTLQLTQAFQGEKLIFTRQGLLIFFSGVFSVGGKIHEITTNSTNSEIIVGKISNRAFEFPIKNRFFSDVKSSFDSKVEGEVLDDGFWAFVSMEKIITAVNSVVKRKKQQDIFSIFNQSPILTEFPLKTLNFLHRKLFIEKSYPLGAVLPREGLFFIIAGGLELLKQNVIHKSVPFSLASFSKGELIWFLNEENTVLRSLSNDTKVLWISQAGLKVFEAYDGANFDKLKENLRQKSKIRRQRYEELLGKVKNWIENKENIRKNEDFDEKIKPNREININKLCCDQCSLDEAIRGRSCQDIIFEKKPEEHNEFICKFPLETMSRSKTYADIIGNVPEVKKRFRRMDSLCSVPSLKEITDSLEEKPKFGSLGDLKSTNTHTKSKSQDKKDFLIKNLKTQLNFFPLSIPNPNKRTLERLALKILNR